MGGPGVLQPLQPQFYIRDLRPEVILRCENQTTASDRADVWLRDAIIEIAGNVDYRESFDELEVYGPIFSLNSTDQEYDFSNFLNEGDYNLETLDVLIWTDYPSNTIRRRLSNSDFQDSDKVQTATKSLPVEWYRFGDTIGFNPPPDKVYQVQLRIMRRHPINDAVIGDTLVLLPREWHEILEWAAVMRGYMEGLEFEKAGNIRTLLYGDPKNPKLPGIIAGVKNRKRRESWLETKSLRPIVRPYGYGV